MRDERYERDGGGRIVRLSEKDDDEERCERRENPMDRSKNQRARSNVGVCDVNTVVVVCT